MTSLMSLIYSLAGGDSSVNGNWNESGKGGFAVPIEPVIVGKNLSLS